MTSELPPGVPKVPGYSVAQPVRAERAVASARVRPQKPGAGASLEGMGSGIPRN